MEVRAYDLGAIGRAGGCGDTGAVPIILRDLGASVSAFRFRNALNGRATFWSPFFLPALPGLARMQAGGLDALIQAFDQCPHAARQRVELAHQHAALAYRPGFVQLQGRQSHGAAVPQRG